MVQLYSAAATGFDTISVLDEIDAGMAEDAIPARFVCACYGCAHDDDQILERLRYRYPYASIIGGTSGVRAAPQMPPRSAEAIGLVAICDADGDYGVGAAAWGDDPAAATRHALVAALEDAGNPAVLPALVWVFQTPGNQNAVGQALRAVVGGDCPIIDASASADGRTGVGRQIGPEGVMTDGIVVAVLCPSIGALAVDAMPDSDLNVRLDVPAEGRFMPPRRRRTGMF